MSTEEDLDLRQEFARLREEELATLPVFARTINAARRRGSDRFRPRRWGFALAAPLAAAAALALWITTAPEAPQSETASTELALDAGLESWEFPTDYLLDAPGTDLLDSTLEIGEVDSYGIELTTEPEPRTDSSSRSSRRYV